MGDTVLAPSEYAHAFESDKGRALRNKHDLAVTDNLDFAIARSQHRDSTLIAHDPLIEELTKRKYPERDTETCLQSFADLHYRGRRTVLASARLKHYSMYGTLHVSEGNQRNLNLLPVTKQWSVSAVMQTQETPSHDYLQGVYLSNIESILEKRDWLSYRTIHRMNLGIERSMFIVVNGMHAAGKDTVLGSAEGMFSRQGVQVLIPFKGRMPRGAELDDPEVVARTGLTRAHMDLLLRETIGLDEVDVSEPEIQLAKGKDFGPQYMWLPPRPQGFACAAPLGVKWHGRIREIARRTPVFIYTLSGSIDDVVCSRSSRDSDGSISEAYHTVAERERVEMANFLYRVQDPERKLANDTYSFMFPLGSVRSHYLSLRYGDGSDAHPDALKLLQSTPHIDRANIELHAGRDLASWIPERYDKLLQDEVFVEKPKDVPKYERDEYKEEVDRQLKQLDLTGFVNVR